MYGNNYPNDYDNKNVVDGTAREVSTESGHFSGQNVPGYNAYDASGRQERDGGIGAAGNAGGAAGSLSAGMAGSGGAMGSAAGSESGSGGVMGSTTGSGGVMGSMTGSGSGSGGAIGSMAGGTAGIQSSTGESGSYRYGSYGGSYQTANGYGSAAGNSYGEGYGGGNGYQADGRKKGGKKEKGSGFWKKALAAVCLGLFFGICAGLGFFAVESATDALLERKESKAAEDRPAGEIADAGEQIGDGTKQTAEGTAGIQGQPAAGDAGQNLAAVMDVSHVAAEVMPAIVSINNTFTQRMSYFGQTLESESTAAGSGIVVGESDTELLIVSNYHVVENADRLIVQFVDGAEVEAQMKGSDPEMDLAVIAVPLKNVEKATKEAIAVAALGDSDSLTVGEPAIAIGNALGYGQSVTVGVISALDRVIDLSGNGEIRANTDDGASFIQTDAAINPGNSGGALLNMKGEVIGINSNKIGGSAVEGMGYAIPISAAKPIIEDLMLRETREKVTEENKGYLGITPLTVVDAMSEDYGMPKGVYVSQVYEGTGAEAAGIVKGNIITEFDGNKIYSSEDLLRVMEYYAVGDTVGITVMYGSPTGWESKVVTVTLGKKFE